MRKVKKLVSLALSSAMVLSLAACGGSSKETTAASEAAETTAASEAESTEETTAADTASSDGFNLAVCLASEPQTIDPALNSAVDGAIMINHMFRCV